MVLPALPALAGASQMFGLAQFGLGAAQAGLGFMAKQQQYASDVAFQNANSKFATWQAGFNARVNDANNQYRYWQETVNYNQELAYANSLRNVETLKAIRQAEVVRDTRAAAGANYILQSEAIASQFAEQEMAAAVAQQQYSWRALQGRASVRAMGREGRSVDRLVNNYARQEGDFMALQQINSDIRGRQYTRAQAGQVAQYLSQYNSQQFYDEAPILDPIPPFPPLPTMVTPPPPSRAGAAPSMGAFGMNLLNAGIGAYGSALGFEQQRRSLLIPNSRNGVGL